MKGNIAEGLVCAVLCLFTAAYLVHMGWFGLAIIMFGIFVFVSIVVNFLVFK